MYLCLKLGGKKWERDRERRGEEGSPLASSEKEGGVVCLDGWLGGSGGVLHICMHS